MNQKIILKIVHKNLTLGIHMHNAFLSFNIIQLYLHPNQILFDKVLI